MNIKVELSTFFSKKVFSVGNQDEEDEDYDNSDEVMGYDDDENSGGQTEQELEFIHPEADYSMLFNRYLLIRLTTYYLYCDCIRMYLCYVTQEAENRREKTRTIL